MGSSPPHGARICAKVVVSHGKEWQEDVMTSCVRTFFLLACPKKPLVRSRPTISRSSGECNCTRGERQIAMPGCGEESREEFVYTVRSYRFGVGEMNEKCVASRRWRKRELARRANFSAVLNNFLLYTYTVYGG